jgi:uncharacterized protein (UPF0216 family)
MNPNKKIRKNPIKYECKICDYITSDKKDYTKHYNTNKHKTNINTNFDELIHPENPIVKKNACKCGKIYKHMSSLCNHKKKCKQEQEQEQEIPVLIEQSITSEQNISILTNLVVDVVKQNQEFQKLILEQNKQIIELSKNNNIINNNNNTNCNNKTKFNMNFFLNEQCKDAVNLTDFVNDLQIQLTDLENVGRLGYIEGISKIFINGLKKLDVSKRPIHCGDLKREILYVKDQNAWEKENEENKKIKKAIHHISSKNIKQIQKWTESHPHYKESDSKQNDQYLQILCESMGSCEPTNLEKIIKNVAKEVVIEK